MSDYRPIIGITMGDPAGIGAEVIVKALADPVLRRRARYVIYGMNEMLSYAADLAEYDVFWWRDQYNGRIRAYPHDVVVVDYDHYSILGHAVRAPSKLGGEASMRFCLDAIEAAKAHILDAVVTAPIAKESWKLAGYHYPGHTELFADRTHCRRYNMMFTGGPLRVVLATVHIPLNGLWGRLNIGAVFQPIELMHQTLVDWFDIPKPKIAVCGLNPHASENGQFGDEEERLISPAILMA
ncbi:MAG: 4-hydroxythreonine-4-phosphate dehydrogenase PdxA, partial [Tepidisphaeraceae bacterium]